MKKLVMFFALLTLMPIVLADWFYNSQNIIANIDISSDAEVVPTTPSGYIDTATINMTFFPKQYDNQELLKFYTNPQAEITNEALKFTWKRPEGKINFRVNADVKTTSTIHQIKQKINFPIEQLPEDIVIYTKPSETIDSNNEDIIRIASELVKGEDDLYSAVFKIADWTKNNINYNLSTLTAEVSQKASWVLQNRQGVCDELTSLFIALLRAVGVPARFTSGIAYTNSSLFPQNWGAHGWAEVYFPGYGWVPFDVTYGEFGWIDPTHIKFKDSVDSNEPSTYYNWVGRNADLKTNKLTIKTDVIDTLGYFETSLRLEASSLKKAVNFGSYNLVTATVENLNDFYYATELYLNKPKEVKIVGNELRSILLLPKEKKEVFWVLKLNDDLDSRYSYTFPLIVSTKDKISKETSFTASIMERDVAFEEIEQIAKLLEENKEKKYSGNVELDCRSSKDELYEYEDAGIDCAARNRGNVFLDDIDICFENRCKKISLGISQTKKVAFEVNTSIIGQRDIPITLRNELVSKVTHVSFKVNDAPRIEIESLEFPVNVSYDENFNVSFTLTKKSRSSPKDVEVIFAKDEIEERWHVDELTDDKRFALRFVGSQLSYGKNDFKISIRFYDGLGKVYVIDKEFSVYLFNANISQRLFLSLNTVGSIFERIGYGTIAMMLLIGSIAFVVVIVFVFRKNKRY